MADARSTTSLGTARLTARLAREPLVQFLAIALLLFGADRVLNGGKSNSADDVVTIPAGRVQQLADSYRLLAGRLPSRAELQALVNDFADEEIAYREAMLMGLDADDTIVRRRLRQKLEFLAEDAEASEEPTDSQLSAWLSERSAHYRLPERLAFRQIMVSADKHGVHAPVRAEAMLDRLQAGAEGAELADASMLPPAMPLTTGQGIAMVFGEAFAAAVFAHDGEDWFGPIASPFGAHAVQILSREPARDPVLADIRDKVRSDWIEARRRAQREAFQARLRERYEIVVEWPEIYADRMAALDRSAASAGADDK